MGIYESPEYEIIKKEDRFEIRNYNEFYVVEYDNDSDPGIQNGFGTLFRYISSENRENQKIKMTVPVIEEVLGDKKKMAFFVSGKFGNRIPEPTSPNLSIRKFEGGIFAAIRYSGYSNKAKERTMEKALSIWIKSKGYSEASNYMLAFYNAPFSPPFLRRNEILVRLENPKNKQ